METSEEQVLTYGIAFERLRSALYRFCQNHGAKHPDDVVQEVFVRAFSLVARDGPVVHDLLPLLCRIATHVIADKRRVSARRPAVSIDVVPENTDPVEHLLSRLTFSDLRDAAKIDGLGHLRFMTRIAVPLARPAIAALGLFAFFSAFNQYLWPLIVTKNDQYRTVQIGLKILSRSQISTINVTFAGIVLAFIPLFVLLLVFQKQLIRGLTAGAVKG